MISRSARSDLNGPVLLLAVSLLSAAVAHAEHDAQHVSIDYSIYCTQLSLLDPPIIPGATIHRAIPQTVYCPAPRSPEIVLSGTRILPESRGPPVQI